MEIINTNLPMGSMNMNNHPEMMIVHHLEAEGDNWTVEAINHMHRTEPQFRFSAIGYHYYIRLNGKIYQGRPDNAVGAHAQGCNSNTLGVAFEGNYDIRTEMPKAQYDAWCELKAAKCSEYGNMPVYGHRDNPRTPGSSECPGANFPLDRVKLATAQPTVSPGWNENTTGWWYCIDVNTEDFYHDCWQEIDGEWYSFDSQGYARRNWWIQDGGKWYWLRENCMMARSQWIWVEGECYCFDEHGVMYADCKTPDGYNVNENGAWIR